MNTDKLSEKNKGNAVLPLVSGSACRELVECADCETKHFKDERIEKKKGAWTTYRCPKCGSESYCRF